MENTTNINLLVGISWCILCGVSVAIVIIYNAYNKAFLRKERQTELDIFKAANEAQELQRQRIANNLHDEIISLISAQIQNADTNKRDFINGQFVIENFARDKEIAYQLIESVRSIALELLPTVLIDLGFINALEAHLKKIRSQDLKVNFINQSGFSIKIPFTPAEQVNIYRMCLEILNNLGKHDHFTSLTINLQKVEKGLVLLFSHNGKGISTEEINKLTESSKGLGLKSIRSRTLLLNASVTYLKDSGNSHVKITIPIRL